MVAIEAFMAKKPLKKKADKKENIDELRNQLARALADYDNLRKRVEKERAELVKLAGFGLVTRLLPIYDMLEDAQKHLGDSGLAIIIKEFNDLFADEEMERIEPCKGMGFDENLHEAVEVVEGKGKNSKIVECLLSGWKYKDGLVIRPAKVKVAKSDKG